MLASPRIAHLGCGALRIRRRGAWPRHCRRAGATDRHQHHTGLRRLAAESGRLVRTAVRLHESRVERRDAHSARPGQQHGAGRPGSRASRRTSSRAATASRSRSTCRRTSATKEIVWTLTSKGRTEKTYGTLKPDYVLDDTSIMSNIGDRRRLSTSPDMVGNKAPVLTLEGPKSRTAKVGEPVAFAAVATDDGKPNQGTCRRGSAATTRCRPTANGLRLSFFVYRGPGAAVTFDPPQTEVWENTRDGGNSPWSAGFKTPPIPGRQQVAGARDVRRARHLRDSRARARRRSLVRRRT